jgi:hypothetical protein
MRRGLTLMNADNSNRGLYCPLDLVRVYLRSSAVALVCLASGCAVGPDYERPAIDSPPTYRFEEKDARDAVDATWWTQFGDRQLERRSASLSRKTRTC